jgi:restriction system protein
MPGIPRMPLADPDAMNDGRFEEAVRDLLIRDGWPARRAGRQDDQAADVTGRHPQRSRIVVQAKHTRIGGKVGAPVMHQVKSTAGPAHRADHAVVITNGGITRDAKTWGERHRIGWTDHDQPCARAGDGTPLHTLLRLPARPRRREPRRDAAACTTRRSTDSKEVAGIRRRRLTRPTAEISAAWRHRSGGSQDAVAVAHRGSCGAGPPTIPGGRP